MAIKRVGMERFREPLSFLSVPSVADEQFRINLSGQYRPALAPIRLLLIGGCVLLVIAILWNLRQTLVAYQDCLMIEAELARVQQQDRDLIVEARREGIDLSEETMKRLPIEVDLANQLLDKRTFSWTTFLTELERTIPSGLALNSVRLDQSATMVRLMGTATSLEDITAFTVGLQDHATFRDPVLAHHRVGVNGLVEFDVTVQYRRNGV